MTYPVIESTASGTWSDEDAWLTYPSGIQPGDLILSVIGNNFDLSEGYQYEVYGEDAGLTNGRLYVMAQIAKGGESGGFEQTGVAGSGEGVWKTYRISNWFGSLSEAVASSQSEWPCMSGVECAYYHRDAFGVRVLADDAEWPDANAANGNPQSGSKTVASGGDILWFTAYVRDGSTGPASVSSPPSGWTQDHFARESTAGIELGIARKQSTNSAETPGAWSLSDTTDSWRAVTFAVLPVWNGAHMVQTDWSAFAASPSVSLDVDFDIDWRPGDLMLLFYGKQGTDAPSLPSGWTLVGGGAGANDMHCRVWAKAATSYEEPNPAFTQNSESGIWLIRRIPAGKWSGDVNDIEMSYAGVNGTTTLGSSEVTASWGDGDNTFIKMAFWLAPGTSAPSSWNLTTDYAGWRFAENGVQVLGLMTGTHYSTAAAASADTLGTLTTNTEVLDVCVVIRVGPKFSVDAVVKGVPDMFVCGAECEVASESPVGGEGNPLDHILQGGTAGEVDSTIYRSGAKSYKFSSTSSDYHVRSYRIPRVIRDDALIERYRAYFRGYFYVPVAAPTTTTVIQSWVEDFGAATTGFSISASDGKLRGFIQREDGTTENSDPVDIPAGEWIGLEVYLDASSNPWVMKWRHWNSTSEWSNVIETSLMVGRSSFLTQMFTGILLAPGALWQINWDDMAWTWLLHHDDSVWDDYVARGGKVLAYLPTSDGTHSFTTGEFQDDAANNLAPTDTNLYTHVDAINDTAEYVSDVTASNVDYFAVQFENETVEGSETDLRGVMLLFRNGNPSASVFYDDMQEVWLVSDDGSTWVNPALGYFSSGIILAPMHAPVPTRPSDGAAWDLSSLNSMQVRLKGEDNITFRWYGVALEAEWVDPQPLLAYAAPDEDISTVGWAVAPLWSKIDDDPNDPDGTTVTASVT